MSSISIKDVLRQLKADLIGKDSYRGVTLTYSWMANQFGHFSLGFIPTLILYLIFKEKTSIALTAIDAAVIISTGWLLFELYNFLGPLLLKRISKSKIVSFTGQKYSFKPAWANIAFDTFTDLCFFWLGAFSAGLLLEFSWTTVFILILVFFILFYPVFYWFLTKMYLQAAQYPFQFRLSQFEGNITEIDKKSINEFLNNEAPGKHLFVFGSNGSGKTSISIGIAAEMSIRHKACIYTTAMKLFSMFFESDTNSTLPGVQLWTWRKSSLLVIDDINPGDPIKSDIITPVEFLDMLDKFSGSNIQNRQTLKSMNVIWVLGNENRDNDLLCKWQNMLLEIGVDKKNISSVNLLAPNLA